MVAGGGASVIYTDTVADLGYSAELGNYGEYSGAPNTQVGGAGRTCPWVIACLAQLCLAWPCRMANAPSAYARVHMGPACMHRGVLRRAHVGAECKLASLWPSGLDIYVCLRRAGNVPVRQDGAGVRDQPHRRAGPCAHHRRRHRKLHRRGSNVHREPRLAACMPARLPISGQRKQWLAVPCRRSDAACPAQRAWPAGAMLYSLSMHSHWASKPWAYIHMRSQSPVK